jgi:hypothetical protein
MSDTSTIKMISAYKQDAPPTLFLSGMFRSPPENFHTTEDVEVDVERGEETISIVMTDLSTGYRDNSADVYTNKRFKPPIFKEKGPINAFDLIQREPGQDPFTSPNFQANASARALKLIAKMQAKIDRSRELQASQVLTTGIITLINAAGTTLYTLNFAPKATHFPTAAVAWDNASSTKIANIDSLADVIRTDGLRDPDMLVFGTDSWELFISDSAVAARFDNRRANLGSIDLMRQPGSGGQLRGVFDAGTQQYACYTYGGRYKHPQTGTVTKFVPDDKVIMMSSGGRLDATFGAIPNFGVADQRALRFIPRRISSQDGVDLFTNAWFTEDMEQLIVGVGQRPLMIPTAIDTYGCLDTNI